MTTQERLVHHYRHGWRLGPMLVGMAMIWLTMLWPTTLTAASANDYQQRVEAGFTAADENRFGDAITELEAVMDQIPADSIDIITDVYNTLQNCYFRLGQIDEALTYGEKILAIDEKSGIAENLSSTLNNLGAICTGAKRYDLAKEYIMRAIEIEHELKRNDRLSVRYGILGEIYANEGNHQEALHYFGQALELDREDGREEKVAIRLSQLGNTLMLAGQYAEAIPYLHEAEPMLRRFNNTPSLAMNLLSLGKAESMRGRHSVAVDHIAEAIRIAQGSGLRQIEMNCNMELSKVYHAMHDARSYDCLTRYISLQDSIHSERVQQQLSELEVRYQIKQKEQEIALDKVTIARQRQLYIGLIILLCLALVMLFFAWRSLKLQRQILHLRDNFYRLISHDLKNPALAQQHSLQQLCRYAEVIDKATLGQQLAHLAQDADAQVALLFDLLDWSSLQTGKLRYSPIRFDLVALAQEVATQHRGQASIKGIDVVVASTAQDPYVTADRQLTASILRNALNNAIKFSSSGEQIEVSIGDRRLTVTDHGQGFDPEEQQRTQASKAGTANETGNALGLALARKLATLNRSELNITSKIGVGTTITLTFAE